MTMDYHYQTYKGFTIKASAKTVPGGYVPGAIIYRAADPAKEFDVRPPGLIFDTEEAAIKDAMEWSRDLVDGLAQDLKRSQLH